MSGRRNRDKDNEDKLSVKGSINLIETDTHKLVAAIVIEKHYPKANDPFTEFSTSLNYNNRDEHRAAISALYGTNQGFKISSKGCLILNKNPTHFVCVHGSWLRCISTSNAFGATLQYDHKNLHKLSLDLQRVKNVYNINEVKLTASGNINLYRHKHHSFGASGKFIRTFRLGPNLCNYNNYSMNLDYLYSDNVGALVGVTHIGFPKETFITTTGKLNVSKNTDTMIELSFGFNKSLSVADGKFTPSIGIRFAKDF